MSAHTAAVLIASAAGALIAALVVLVAIGELRYRRSERRGGLLELDSPAARDAIGGERQ